LVELVKREINPVENRDKDSWLTIAKKAVEVRNTLDGEEQRILDILSQPSKFRGFHLREDRQHLVEYFAHALLEEDVKLLDPVNRKRPRVFLGSPNQLRQLRGSRSPYDPSASEEAELQEEIDQKAREVLTSVGNGTYAEVVSTHMRNLGLPFVAIVRAMLP
jgi:hypothetical protein